MRYKSCAKQNPNLDTGIQILSNQRNPATQVKITRRAVADSCLLLGDKLHFVVPKIDGMCKDGLLPEQLERIIHIRVRTVTRKQLPHFSDIIQVFGDVNLDADTIFGGEVT